MVRMIRTADGLEAEVHPDMVEHYRAGGYEVAEPEQKAKRKAKAVSDGA